MSANAGDGHDTIEKALNAEERTMAEFAFRARTHMRTCRAGQARRRKRLVEVRSPICVNCARIAESPSISHQQH